MKSYEIVHRSEFTRTANSANWLTKEMERRVFKALYNPYDPLDWTWRRYSEAHRRLKLWIMAKETPNVAVEALIARQLPFWKGD